MQDSPRATDLLRHVAEELKGGLPSKFHERVAANAVALALRDLELAPLTDEAERDRLALLLGREGSLHALNRELARAIRARKITTAAQGLVEHLWLTTCEKMRVDQPNYPAFQAFGER